MNLTHIITGLDTGGAEMMLYKLLSRMDRAAFEAQVVSLTDIGPIGQKIQALGIPVRALRMHRGMPNPVAVLRLARWLRRDSPHLIQTWMYHADMIGGLAARVAGGIPVVWGIRQSNLDPQKSKRTTIWTARTCARLSHWLPIRIVCCSEGSRRVHTKLGYAAHKMVVIPNGFDLTVFRPDPVARLSVRQELGIPKDAPVIGLVGRFDPQKDHRNFVLASRRVHALLPDAHFLMCGEGVAWENQDLAGWIMAAGFRDRCHLLGRREDISRLNATLDVACSSSAFGEGFTNAIGEAMACGVPCVVTDVGDSALLVGDTGRIVPSRDPQALAEACYELIELRLNGGTDLGLAPRRRVEEHFSLPAIVARYEGLYDKLAGGLRGGK